MLKQQRKDLSKKVTPSANKLIGEIRNMENRKTMAVSRLNCEMIDKKNERREHGKRKVLENQGNPELAISQNRPVSKPKTRAYAMDIYRQNKGDSSSIHWMGKERVRTPVATWSPSSCQSLPKVFDAVKKGIYRTFGEIVVQLERRILLHVFPDADETYYGTLSDIRGVIRSEPSAGKRARYMRHLACRNQRLERIGWSIGFHLNFGSQMVQKYGVGAPAFLYTQSDPLATHAQLARLIARKLPREERICMIIMLTSLLSLALEDGRPLFLPKPGEDFESM